jgi:hypothetical protein
MLFAVRMLAKDATDETHLKFAVEQGRTIVSGNSDFLVLHDIWHQAGKTHCGIVYITPHLQGNIGTVVKELSFLYEAVLGGAATLESDVYNTVRYIG